MATMDLGRVRGTDGVGVPSGGTAGQVLSKASEKEHDTKWIDPPSGGGAGIDDTNTSIETTYSSEHIEEIVSELIEAIDAKECLTSDPQEGTEAPEMGDPLSINADQLGGKTYQTIIDILHPIGSIYMTLSEADNPNTKFDWQKWEQIQNRFLLGAGSTYTVGVTGGEASHKLQVNNMTRNSLVMLENTTGKDIDGYGVKFEPKTLSPGDWFSETVGNMQNHGLLDSSNVSINHMPPYIAVNIWKRVS